MTASPSTASVTSPATHLDHLFLHLRSCSRSVNESFEVAEAAIKNGNVDLELIAHENNVSRFLAIVAPAAVERMHLVEVIAPGYAEADECTEELTSLEPAPVDALVRPLFEAAGILDDFMPWHERFPLGFAPPEEAAARET